MKKWFVLGSMAIILGVSRLWAQDACLVLPAETLQLAQESCSTTETGSVCVATDGIMLNDESVEINTFADLSTFNTLTTRATSIAILQPTLGSPDAVVQFIAYGETSLKNEVVALEGEMISLPLKNIAGYDVNLREGAGTNFNTTGTFPADAEGMTDGRSADSQWFRIQTDAGLSWVNASLVQIDGDVSTLSVVDSAYTEPFQAFILQTSTLAEGCNALTSGLLVQYTGEAIAKLNVNGAEIAFSDATFLIQAEPETGLQVQVLAGEVSVKANKTEQIAQAGEAITASLDATSLLVSDTPDLVENYTYANMASAPLDLLAVQDANLCITGVPLSAEELLTRGGPGVDYSELAPLDNQSHYEVAGFATDANNATWYKLDNGRWVEASGTALAGSCSGIVEVEAPPLNQEQSVVSNQSFIPTQNTRWQAYSGNDVMTGTCSSAPIAVCDHLAVVVVNADGSLAWRGQEPISYPLVAQGGNRYTYSGRNFQNNANLSLDLTFTSSTSWSMTMTTVFDSDPTCTHTFYYTAAKL